MKKGELLYEGKAKKIFTVHGRSDVVWQEMKDDMTAFNGERHEVLPGKGQINLAVTEILFKALEHAQIKTHFVQRMSDKEFVTQRLQMIPLEVVVRNVWAGSSAKKFGQVQGEPLKSPLFELYFKSDALSDPFMSTEQAVALGVARSAEEIDEIKALAFRVNDVLKAQWDKAGVTLVDFKIELGKLDSGEILVGDEISGDSSRLWDKETGRVLDKDRFRKDMGEVISSYEEALHRLQKAVGGSL